MRKKLLWATALVALTLLLAACSGGGKPQNTFDPAGPTALKEKNIYLLPFWIAVGVFVLVEGGIVLIAVKYRHRKGRDRMPTQTHGNSRLEIGWTIAPALVLAVVMVPTVALIWDLAKVPPPDSLHVTVQGYQWWWGFQYTDDDMKVSYGTQGPIITADTLVIPAQRTVYLALQADGGLIGGANPDHVVIHSFWAPRLFGKQDVMPGRTNHITFSADQPGTYWGQCAEFCGLQHGMMKFRIVALSQTDWDAWVANQRSPAAEPTDPLAKQGMDLFLNGVSSGGQCITCHAVGGSAATSPAAPNLTHFAAPTHECFAGCDWETYGPDGAPNLDDLRAWLTDPNAVKLGSKMPNYHLTNDEIDALMAYLYGLR